MDTTESNRDRARSLRCVLHIGTLKTGTGSIQKFLAQNRERFQTEGVVYPRFTGLNGGSQWGFVAASVPDAWTFDFAPMLGIRSSDDRQDYERRLIEAVDDEIARVPSPRTLLISSEHFYIRLNTPSKIRQLQKLLCRWTDHIQVVIYLRRQDRLAFSWLSTRVKAGLTALSEFPFSPHPEDFVVYDYEKNYLNWAEVFGRDNITVRVFEKPRLVEGNLLADFCEAAQIAISGKALPDRMNQSITQDALHFLMEVNRLTPKVIDGLPNHERRRLVTLVSNMRRGHPNIVSRQQAKDFHSHYRDSNDRLNQAVFQQLNESLFDDDFSEYPVEADQIERRYEDAVKIAIAIWSKLNENQTKSTPLDQESVADLLREIFRRIVAKASRA